MTNKFKLTLVPIIVFIMTQFISCQDKNTEQCPKEGFCVQDTLLYYNQQPLTLGASIEDFVETMGKYDRKIEDSTGGAEIYDYFWNTKLIMVNKHFNNDYFTLVKMKIDNETGKQIEDTNADYVKYKSLEEIIKKYGKYDSIKIDNVPVRTTFFYVWDQLGVSISTDKNGKHVGNIFLQTLHYSKYTNPKNKKVIEGLLPRPETDEDRAEMAEYIKTVSEYPKNEYKGKFTYNKHTVDFSTLDDENWDKVVKGLKISGERYDPPGDSENWSREIRATYDLYINLGRANSTRDHMKDRYNAVQYITISWNKTNEEIEALNKKHQPK